MSINLISADNISLQLAERQIISNLSFGVSEGEKIALIGRNGVGKSTLMKIMAGILQPDSGQLAQKKDIRVTYLPQESNFDQYETIYDAFCDLGGKQIKLVLDYKALLMEEEPDLDLLEKWTTEIDESKSWDIETRAEQILSKLGLNDTSQKIKSLSGGQKKRLSLAIMVITEPDLMLLDEPTNHLDLEIIEWLEDYISTSRTSLVMVTHDRYFLDKICNKILELDQGTIFSYTGNYAYFLEKRMERWEQQALSVQKAKNLYTKELDWIRRQPKARGTKAQYRVDAFEQIKDKAHQKLDVAKLELSGETSRQGNKVIEVENVFKSYPDKKILNDFTYFFKKKDRIGIIGANGVGKSSFLNMITGSVKPDSGRIDRGLTTQIGYYTQLTSSLNPENRVIEEVKEIAEYVKINEKETISIGKFLEKFLFPSTMHFTPIHLLSGGEKRRLQLLKILVKNPNFLILDEPTNDLDIDTLNVLENYLAAFDGSLIIVSHDRYFMDQLCEHLFIFEGDGVIKDFPGNYTDYREELENSKTTSISAKKSEANSSSKAPAIAPKEVKKLSYKEQKEYQDLEISIQKSEERRDKITLQMSVSNLSHADLTSFGKEINDLNAQIETMSMRWLELGESI